MLSFTVCGLGGFLTLPILPLSSLPVDVLQGKATRLRYVKVESLSLFEGLLNPLKCWSSTVLMRSCVACTLLGPHCLLPQWAADRSLQRLMHPLTQVSDYQTLGYVALIRHASAAGRTSVFGSPRLQNCQSFSCLGLAGENQAPWFVVVCCSKASGYLSFKQ